jgi:hypothetical protein
LKTRTLPLSLNFICPPNLVALPATTSSGLGTGNEPAGDTAKGFCFFWPQKKAPGREV